MKGRQETPARAIARSPTLLAALVCLAAGLTLGCAARQPGATARPWLKPPEQWTQADAEQILADSPWVKRVKRTFGFRSERRIDNSGCVAWESAMGPTDPPNSRVCTQWESKSEVLVPEDSGIRVDVTFSWESARTICSARNWSAMDSRCPESNEHRITVRGQNIPSLLYLELGSGQRIPLKWDYGNHGRLFFPAKLPDGTPTIGPNERSATLVTFVQHESTKYRIKVKFDLRKMVTAKGRDL